MNKEKLRKAQKEIKARIEDKRLNDKSILSGGIMTKNKQDEYKLKRKYRISASRLEGFAKRNRDRRNKEISKDLN